MSYQPNTRLSSSQSNAVRAAEVLRNASGVTASKQTLRYRPCCQRARESWRRARGESAKLGATMKSKTGKTAGRITGDMDLQLIPEDSRLRVEDYGEFHSGVSGARMAAGRHLSEVGVSARGKDGGGRECSSGQQEDSGAFSSRRMLGKSIADKIFFLAAAAKVQVTVLSTDELKRLRGVSRSKGGGEKIFERGGGGGLWHVHDGPCRVSRIDRTGLAVTKRGNVEGIDVTQKMYWSGRGRYGIGDHVEQAELHGQPVLDDDMSTINNVVVTLPLKLGTRCSARVSVL